MCKDNVLGCRWVTDGYNLFRPVAVYVSRSKDLFNPIVCPVIPTIACDIA